MVDAARRNGAAARETELHMKKVCVYCSSSAKIASCYFDAGYEVVFGGGALGLMGRLADAVLAKKGKIVGIMPRFMREVEWAHRDVEDFIFTETMHERKARLLEGADAVVALPGGTGTLEELFEVITLKRLGLYLNPIVIVNTNDFYAPLWEMLLRCVSEHFMSERNLAAWRFVDRPDEVVPAIRDDAGWDPNAIHFAANR